MTQAVDLALPTDGTIISFYGGLGEIGANMCSIERDGHAIIVDVGVTFPDANHPGVDLILPNWDDLIQRKPVIDGVVLTHGHEDHIGAVPFFLRDFPGVKVYGSKLTLGLLNAKLEEHPGSQLEAIEVEAGESIPVGHWDLEFVAVNHSIPDSLAVAVHGPDGTIVHTGDFRMDQTPIDNRTTDLPHLAQLGDHGVDLLLADSTNACIPGLVPSERTVGATLRREFAKAHGRIIVTTFASHIHRVQQVLDAALETGRKVAFVGRSMVRNLPIARALGYLQYEDSDIVDIEEASTLPDREVAVLCTGSQGEPFAALSLMAAGTHRFISMESGDTVIMACSQIPGNEAAISKVINGLYRQGANVVYQRHEHVHVSGHASADELLLFHNVVRPRAFVPVHGEYRHLVEHAELARQAGVPDEQVQVCSDGDRIVLRSGQGISRTLGFAPGRTMVDGLSVGDVGANVLRARQRLSAEGVVIVAVRTDRNGKLVERPEIMQQGLFFEDEHPDLISQAEQVVATALEHRAGSRTVAERTIHQTMAQFWREILGRKPVVVPVVMEA